MTVIKFDDIVSQNSREWTEVGYVYIVIVDMLSLLITYAITHVRKDSFGKAWSGQASARI
jgi:hypothetical protein